MSTGRQRVHCTVLALYLVLALVLTYPVLTSPSTLVPGSDTWAYDEYTFLWNIWWFKHSLLDLGVNPLHSSYTFYPVGVPLILYTYNLLYCALAQPIFLAANLVLASNITLWLGLALTGYTAYLLTRYVISRQMGRQEGPGADLAAMVAGLGCTFAASRFVYLALGHYMLTATMFLPVFVLFLLRALDEPHRWHKRALLAGLAFALSALAELTFALFLGIALLILAGLSLRRLGWRVALGRASLAIGSGVILCAPLLYRVAREALAKGYALIGWGDSLRLSADLVGLFTPTSLHPVWGDQWAQGLREVVTGTSRFSDVNTVVLGYASLLLALVGALAYRRRAVTWIVISLTATVLSLGPLLQINGRWLFDLDGLETTVPLPFILLHYIPLVSAGRAPNRFSVLLLLGLAPLVAYGCYYILHRFRNWRLSGTIAAILAITVLWDGLSVPLPVTNASVPAFYQQLAQDREDYAILSLPFGLRDSFGTRGAERTQLQYYQTVHQKRFVGGNISRAPAIAFEYYEGIAPLAGLMAVQAYQEPEPLDPAELRRQAGELAALLDIRYLIVHAPVPGRWPYADTHDEALAYAHSIFDLTEVHRDPGGRLVAYRVAQATVPESLTLDLGHDAEAAMYLGAGWSAGEDIAGASARWIDGGEAVLYLPAEPSGEHVLTLSAAPFSFADAPEQVMTISVNGQEIASFGMDPSWQQYTTSPPLDVLHRGPNTVSLRFAYARRPVDVLPEAYFIGNTGRRAPLLIEVTSNPEIAYITVGNQDGSRHAHGLNAALFDLSGGRLLQAEIFAWGAADRLYRFLASAGRDTGAVVAAKGGVPADLDPAICRALNLVGGAACPTPGAGGYALIGVIGAPPGTALEASGPDAYLRIAPDTRLLSAAVDWVRLERLH